MHTLNLIKIVTGIIFELHYVSCHVYSAASLLCTNQFYLNKISDSI